MVSICNNKDYCTCTAKLKTIFVFLLFLYNSFAQETFFDQNNDSKVKVEQLELVYVVWGCTCPQWIEAKFEDKENAYKNGFHFYLEPAHDSLSFYDEFDAFEHNLIVEGAFYAEEGFPKDFVHSEEPSRPARVFRFYNYKIIEKEKKND